MCCVFFGSRASNMSHLVLIRFNRCVCPFIWWCTRCIILNCSEIYIHFVWNEINAHALIVAFGLVQNAVHTYSYTFLFRLPHQNEWSHINFHISNSHSSNASKCFDMPAGPEFYLITTLFHFVEKIDVVTV